MPVTQPDNVRVCIVAENASFRFGGEASLPLHYFSRLRARGIPAWLVIHGRTQAELAARFPDQGDRILYIPDQWFHRVLWRLSAFLPRRVSEAIFGNVIVLLNQLIHRSMVRRLIQEYDVNLVHQPIPVSPKAPSSLFGLGVPVIIGPMNGGMNYPDAFRDAESRFTRIVVALGRSSANLVNRLIPGKKKASILLVANHRTRLALPDCVEGRVIDIPENGVDLAIWSLPAKASLASGPPRFLFIGRLVDWKRLDFVLHALAQVPDALLEVIGDGPMRPAWTALAKSLGIEDRVRFLAWLPQPECAQRLHGSTALLLPSIYECGGAVVLEAMATGTPVIATAWGGPADYVDESCGILVEPSNPETIIEGFRNGMNRLIADPNLRISLGTAGRLRIEHLYDWDQKIDRILEIYQEALHETRR